MKKLTALLALLLVLAGCGGNSRSEAPIYVPVDIDLPDAPAGESNNKGGTASVAVTGDLLADGTTHGQLTQRQTGDVIEIKEKLFIAQTNDIYLNPEDYLGKTIKYEGIYQVFTWESEDGSQREDYHYVIRYGPGCCGDDDNAGFEVAWEGEWPSPDEWVEAVGVLEMYEESGWPYLQLNLQTLTVKTERGAEYVTT